MSGRWTGVEIVLEVPWWKLSGNSSMGWGKGEGGSVTFTPRAAICHVFRRMARLSFKPNTEICVFGRSVNSLC